MKEFFTSSIGQKFLMSLTGLFLISFLCVHLTLNILLLFGDGTIYNTAAHFMSTNVVMKVLEPILAIGFIIHILYSVKLTVQNIMARPQGYAVVNQANSSKWASRNMLILGSLIGIFLTLHLINFFWKIKFGTPPTTIIDGTEMHNTYALVSSLFIEYWWYDAIYILGAIFLGLHLHHAFWSAFQTLGMSNIAWRKRLEVLGDIFAIIIASGFSVIPLYFWIFR